MTARRVASERRESAAREITPQKGLSLTVTGLSVSRSGTPVLDNIDFHLSGGEAAILRGDNGAGKTTLLRTLAGLLPVDQGKITLTVNGTMTPPAEIKRHAVFFGHKDSVKNALTGRETLRFWSRLYGAEMSSALDAARRLEIDALLDRPAGALSAGQRRRLGLCRAVLSAKALWLLDEPTASMDARSAGIVMELVSSHCADGGGALIATHDPLSLANARAIRLQTVPAAA